MVSADFDTSANPDIEDLVGETDLQSEENNRESQTKAPPYILFYGRNVHKDSVLWIYSSSLKMGGPNSLNRLKCI
jgi:hypothetical protein